MAKYQVPEIWSEIHHDFKQDARGNLKKVLNLESIYSSIDNIIGTHQGERCMLPNFGSSLKDMLFENIDSHLTNFVATEIKRAIEVWDDRVIVDTIDFSVNPDNNEVSMSLKFSVRGQSSTYLMNKTIR